MHEAGKRDERMRGMGTTLCVLVIIGSHGFIAHVGDSRIYLVRGDKTTSSRRTTTCRTSCSSAASSRPNRSRR